jgi:TolB-like protein
MSDPSTAGPTGTPPPAGGVSVRPESTHPAPGLWQRLKEHKVMQWTLVYAAAAYTVLHGTEMLSDAQEWPHVIVRVLSMVLILGVPIVATLAWFHGHRGLQRVSGAEIAILTLLLFGAGSILWWLSREHGERVAAVAAVAAVSPPPMAPVAIAAPAKSIAVLPFLDMSEKKDQEYFSDGLAEELLDLLAKIPGLHVIARTSAFSFKGKSEDIPTIAKKLNVANILEGSVRKSGNRLRVTTQLIRADTDEHLWSETYDRELKDVFQVQDEIAGAVVAVLKVKLEPGQQASNSHRTSNTDAYNQYLLGRQFFDRLNIDGFRRAVEANHKAIELDPGYAAAYAGLAMSRSFVADQTGDAAGLQQALAAADKAVALAPDQADGYATRGYLRFTISWDWIGAQTDLEKALALDPGDSAVQRQYGGLLASLGRLPEGIAAAAKATELDPLSSPAWTNLGYHLIANGQFAAAHEAIRRALEIQPESHYALFNLGKLQLLDGKAVEALATFRPIGFEGFRLTGIAMAEHTLGHAKESQQALDELIAMDAEDGADQIAQVFAWRGEKDKAFEWLERAYRQRDGGMVDIKDDVLLARLRDDARFTAMLRKMKLPE